MHEGLEAGELAAEEAAGGEGRGEAQDGTRYRDKGRGPLRLGPAVKFEFVAKHRVIWPVAMLCGALGVARSGYYA